MRLLRERHLPASDFGTPPVRHRIQYGLDRPAAKATAGLCGIAAVTRFVHDAGPMKLYVTYGFLIALGSAILTMALFALGYHSENLAAGQKLGYLGIVIAIAGLSFGMREYRNEVGKGVMSYGRALGTGVLISMWSTLFSAVFNIVYFMVINPGFSEAMVQFQMAEMEKKGMPAATIEQSEGVLRFFMSAPMITIMGAIMGMIFCVVLSLVLAAIFKSKSGQSAPPPVAA